MGDRETPAAGASGGEGACAKVKPPSALETGPGSRRVVQKRAVRHDGWTRKRRETFLAVLAQTCNVVQATRAAEMRDKAAYDLRKRDPAFARLFAEALALGYERLEGALLSHALEGVNAIDVTALPDHVLPEMGAAAGMPGIAPPGGVTQTGIELALTMLKHHAAMVKGSGKRRVPVTLPSPEETDRLLLERLKLLAKKKARQAAAVKP